MKFLTQKQKEEINIVKKYLENEKINFKEEEIQPNSEQNHPVDVFWKDKKFQVAYADGKLEKPRRTGNVGYVCITKTNSGRKIFWRDYEKDWKDIIIEPLEKHKFDKSARKIIFLLYCIIEQAYINEIFFKNEFKKFIKKEKLEECNFYKIILVCPNKNYQIFPIASRSQRRSVLCQSK